MAGPRVSVVMPLFNEERHVAAALDSCLAQSLVDIEIICVDDASTDRTVEIVKRYQQRDARIRLLRQPASLSVLQARNAGIAAATAPYVLFLDGGDELAPQAAQLALSRAEFAKADVVGFGVDIIADHSAVPPPFEAPLRPTLDALVAPNIVPSLFPADKPVNVHIWCYMFATSTLRRACEGFAPGAIYDRSSDLPLAFLALTHATRYVSTPERLYRHNFRGAASNVMIENGDDFRSLIQTLEPISAIRDSLSARVDALPVPNGIAQSYESARLFVIANVLRRWAEETSGELQNQCLALLREKVGSLDVIRAAARFFAESLPALSRNTHEPSLVPPVNRNVLLTTVPVEGLLPPVTIDQAIQLSDAGYRVTLAVLRDSERELALPPEIDAIVLDGDLSKRLDAWVSICRDQAIEFVIDHQILRNSTWPWFVLISLALGIETLGWAPRFASRYVVDQYSLAHLRLLRKMVTPSRADVAFWKLQGVERVVYLPVAPSALALAAIKTETERSTPKKRLELAWWGRFDRSTKQVHHLITVAEHLRKREVHFRLTLSGADSSTMSAKQLRQLAVARGVDDAIDLIPKQSPGELLDILRDTDLMVSASTIDTSQTTILEAQALGMPVVMYELPWSSGARDNPGIVVTSPGDPAALADAIASIARTPQRYAELSAAAHARAHAEVRHYRAPLLLQLLSDELPPHYSPDPKVDEARLLFSWLIEYSARTTRYATRTANAAEADAKRARTERDHLKREMKHVLEGPSYRLGRALTWLPRRARALRGRPSDALPAKELTGPTPIRTSQPEVAPPLQYTPGTVRRVFSASADVSVVVPVYNSEPWLEACLSSILAQTNVQIEVICVNDGSSDRSRVILERVAKADARVVIIDQPNSGQSVARNTGVDAASGRYVLFLDSDDYWSRDELQNLVSRADRENLDVLLFDGFAFRDGDIDVATWQKYATYYQRTFNYRLSRPGAEMMAAMRREREYLPHVGLYMTRTAYVRKLGLRFIPGIVHQDNPYTFELLLNAGRVAHTRVDAYARRLRPGSTVTTLSPEKSARGYYLSYLAMMRARKRADLPTSVAEQVDGILDGVLRAAKTQFKGLSAHRN